MMNVEEVSSEQQFEQILAANTKVVVDFWAPWCSPCKMMATSFEQVADEHSTTLKAIKVNVDDLPAVAQKYGIRSIPTLLLLKESSLVAEHLGLAAKQEIITWLNQH